MQKARDTVWFVEQATSQFILPHQTAKHRLSGLRYLWHRPIPCSPVLYVCQQTEAAPVKRLVRHGTECHRQRN